VLRLCAGALLLLVLGASSVAAAPEGAARSVSIQDSAFAPATITLNAGDTLTWTNADSIAHTASSTAGVWNSGTLNPGRSFTFTFVGAGTFAYRCEIHPSMTGTVVVRGAATPVPTPVPTPVRTPAPIPTATPPPAASAPVATPQPAIGATATPSLAPTATATAAPSPSSAAAATPSATPSASTAAAALPSAPAPAPRTAAASDGGPPAPILVAAAAVLVVGLAGAALVLLRR